MLRPVNPADRPPPSAYRVPWRVVRDEPRHPIVINDSTDPADFVRVFTDATDQDDRTQLWGRVLPADHIRVCLCDTDLDSAIVTLAWYRPSDGLEYLWRFVP
jgi:hypothetical protein